MKKYSSLTSGKLGDYKDENEATFADLTIHYGIEDGITNEWENIINTKDTEEKKKKIDALIERLEQNSQTNGFFKSQDKVSISAFCGVKLDDKEIYYLFFAKLEKIYKLLLKAEKKEIEGFAIYSAIKETLQTYFDKDKNDTPFDLKEANKKRFNLSAITANENDEFIPPSISVFKNSGCAMCVEKSSVAHNLWLMCGKKSYYFTSKSVFVDASIDDGHAFCVVEYNNKFRIFDPTLGNYGILDCNPIELIKDNIPFKVTNKNVPIVYVQTVFTNQKENNLN